MQGSACSLSVRWKKSAKKWHFLSLHIKDKCDSFESSLNYFIFTVLYSYSGHQCPQQLLKSCTCQNLSIIASVTTCTVTETAAEKEEILNSFGCQNFAVETCLWWYQCHLFEQYCVRWIESNPGWAAHWTGEDSGRCHQGSLADGGERALQTSRVDAKEKEVENHTTSGTFGMLVARSVNSKKVPHLAELAAPGVKIPMLLAYTQKQPHKHWGTQSLSTLRSDALGKAIGPDSNKQPALRGEGWCAYGVSWVPVWFRFEPQGQEQATVTIKGPHNQLLSTCVEEHAVLEMVQIPDSWHQLWGADGVNEVINWSQADASFLHNYF